MNRACEILAIFAVSVAVLFMLYWKEKSWPGADEPLVFGKFFSILFSALLLACGIYGLLTDNISIPLKRGSAHLHGWAVRCFFLATVCGAAFFLSAMGRSVPGYNRQLFRRIAGVLGWLFLVLSLSVWAARA